jgi:5-formyltetrahydrofolate cyclo-ligase
MEELAPGMLGILEPPEDLRRRPEKRIDAERLDLVMVPGAAFDARGGRIGRGKGYYDRLLRRTRPDALRVGVAFQCQIFPGVPMQEHDVFMDKVITEDTVYEGTGGTRIV